MYDYYSLGICALWERIQKTLNQAIKAAGHDNIYCPLFIPLSHIEKKKPNILRDLQKECAVVTHSKLSTDSNGQLQPDGKLDEPLIIRPTSEMVIGEYFSQRIQSHRDLPVLINQWANVVRWEMRTRMFLRTTKISLARRSYSMHTQKGRSTYPENVRMLSHPLRGNTCYTSRLWRKNDK